MYLLAACLRPASSNRIWKLRYVGQNWDRHQNLLANPIQSSEIHSMVITGLTLLAP
jgi:hypothetical protein